MKIIGIVIVFFGILSTFNAQNSKDNINSASENNYNDYLHNLTFYEKEKNIKYDSGLVSICDEIELNIPKGMKFMDKSDAADVVFDLWKNRVGINNILGLLVKSDFKVYDFNQWAFIVTIDRLGYVKDDSADKLDYNQILEEMKSQEEIENKSRIEDGLPTINMVDWAIKPYYEKSNNSIYWAKKYLRNDNKDTLINFEIRYFSRNGFINFNAVGYTSDLDELVKLIPLIYQTIKFKPNYAYSDFNPKEDMVSKFNVGGVVNKKPKPKWPDFLIIIIFLEYALGAAALYGGLRIVIFRLWKKKKRIPLNSDRDKENS